MTNTPLPKSTGELLDTVLDAMPGQVMVVDQDFRVYRLNARARKSMTLPQDQDLGVRGGDVLRCKHFSKDEGGCTGGEACQRCQLRKLLVDCLEQGKLLQTKTRFLKSHEGHVQEQLLLVSAAPFQHADRTLVMLMIEDLTQLATDNEFLSICAECKKVRKGDDEWESFESYFGDRLGLDFSHAICPDCLKKLYPGFGKT